MAWRVVCASRRRSAPGPPYGRRRCSAMELVLCEDPQEDVLGEDVLQQHLADVGGGHGGAYALLAQLQEGRCGLLILRVVYLGLLYGLPQVAD